MMKQLFFIIMIGLFMQACHSVKKEFINPFGSKPAGYTHVVVSDCAKTIFISGQVPVNEKGELVHKNDFAGQTRQVFENLKTALQAAGATFDDIVKLGVYIKDYSPAQLPVFRDIRNEYVSKDNPPASTLVGVQSLYNADVMIEIEATAIIAK